MKKITCGEQDITEGVQILYDIVHQSMDWSSGFLDNEEMTAVIQLAVDMGWQVPSLPNNAPALLNVAKQFPEHYEITEHQAPGTYSPEGVTVLQGGTHYLIKTIKKEKPE